MLSPHQENFDLLEGTPGHHTKWELMAGPPFLEESGDGDATGRVVYVNTASKADLDRNRRRARQPQGAIALVRLGAPGGGGIRNVDPSWIAYNELRKRGVVGILEFMEPATSGYGGGATWPSGNYKNTNMAERMGGMSPRGFLMFPPGDPTMTGQGAGRRRGAQKLGRDSALDDSRAEHHAKHRAHAADGNERQSRAADVASDVRVRPAFRRQRDRARAYEVRAQGQDDLAGLRRHAREPNNPTRS